MQWLPKSTTWFDLADEVLAGCNLIRSPDCMLSGSSFDLLALVGRYVESTGVSLGELLLSLDNEEHVETLTTEQSEPVTLSEQKHIHSCLLNNQVIY